MVKNFPLPGTSSRHLTNVHSQRISWLNATGLRFIRTRGLTDVDALATAVADEAIADAPYGTFLAYYEGGKGDGSYESLERWSADAAAWSLEHYDPDVAAARLRAAANGGRASRKITALDVRRTMHWSKRIQARYLGVCERTIATYRAVLKGVSKARDVMSAHHSKVSALTSPEPLQTLLDSTPSIAFRLLVLDRAGP